MDIAMAEGSEASREATTRELNGVRQRFVRTTSTISAIFRSSAENPSNPFTNERLMLASV